MYNCKFKMLQCLNSKISLMLEAVQNKTLFKRLIDSYYQKAHHL